MASVESSLLAARLYIRASFGTHRPKRDDNYQPASVKGSVCLASPFAFQYKQIVNFVNEHPAGDWLVFAYADRNELDIFKQIAVRVWQSVKPGIKNKTPEQLKQLSLLTIPALIEVKELKNKGKRAFKVAELCNVLGIDYKNNHFHRDYKWCWELLISEVEKMDSAALLATDEFIYLKELYQWPLLEDSK